MSHDNVNGHANVEGLILFGFQILTRTIGNKLPQREGNLVFSGPVRMLIDHPIQNGQS